MVGWKKKQFHTESKRDHDNLPYALFETKTNHKEKQLWYSMPKGDTLDAWISKGIVRYEPGTEYK